MSKPPRDSDWLRHQAQARQAAKAQLSRPSETDVQRQQQARKVLHTLVSQTIAQQQRLSRLAVAFADRCHRVHELSGLYRAEWERAQRLQADNDELRRRIAHLESASDHPGSDQCRAPIHFGESASTVDSLPTVS
jgi:septal ring factor EnvC (AmiA/AmiB activator)